MFAALIIATVLDLSLALPPSPLLTHAARLHCAAAWTCLQPKVLAERVGFEPTVRITAQRLSSSMILMLTCPTLYLSVWSGSPFLSR